MKRLKINEDQKSLFGQFMLEELQKHPFGTLSKAELELLVFSALKDTKIIPDSNSAFTTSTELDCSKSKVETMLYAFRHRNLDDETIDEVMFEVVRVAEVIDSRVVFSIEEKFFREMFIDRLKQAEIYTDTSFNRERVIVKGAAFVMKIYDLFPVEQASTLHELVNKAAIEEENPEKVWLKIAKWFGGSTANGTVAYSVSQLLDEIRSALNAST